MSKQELSAIRELVEIARQVSFRVTCQDSSPTAYEKASLVHAIDLVGPMVYPAWNHGQS